MILIIKEKKPNLLDLMWKIKVNIITSCATLWNKMEEFWSTILFEWATLEDCQARLAHLRSR